MLPVTVPAERAAPPGAARPARAAARRPVVVAVLLLAVLLLLMTVRLPWSGDLGMHAAVLERLRADPLHPGNPLVDAPTPSPYYSPWTVLLALTGSATGWGTFTVLRLGALAGLALLGTGVHAFVRTFTRSRTAVPLAVLCLLLLYGVRLFAWSGVLGLTSISLTLAYPSTFAFGMAFHLWALLRRALAAAWGTAAFLGLGLLLAGILLTHQFTGAVAVLGAAAVLLGARPWPGRAVWLRVAAACALAAAVLACWPYYAFFSLLGTGGLDDIHRPLYDHLATKFCLAGLGVAALALRARRDRRDPLVIFFGLGLAVFAAGGLSGHQAWGRILPAVLVPAQLALALEAASGGRRVRAALVPLTAVALLAGAWTQAGVLTYVLRPQALPPVLRHLHTVALWPRFTWAAREVPARQTVMTDNYYALRMLPAYGPYTVAPAYPDVFLPDAARRRAATRRYFAPATSRAERLGILKEYRVRWVLQKNGGPGLDRGDPALRRTVRGPAGFVLSEVAP
ncbi:hypothetical protein [Streptomyces hiroshimensis]|uniref:Glycosyltransferase RgtA/B/C/D-like domain-containing protein n=1 Tax=Streptomyces hiroshimensis TaxID=66424 RepID=A0ABQ2Y8F7_9ACTN|nr:hypothetical protein [Streptomyces hiroshimensis]GGX68300.1 hypothetical protein GCM10010324_11300 [Streptomyces hiroshimensis]